MRAMLGLEVEFMTGFMPGGGRGLSPSAPALENLSSLGFVSLIFFLSARAKRIQQQRSVAKGGLVSKTGTH